jgi:predicted anti-sigma-YlaC factor YlaD
MNCKQTEELLPLYAGRELEEKRATLVTEHLQTCPACACVADEYRESVQLTEQFAPPVFSEAVYAGIRQHVLREIETEAMAPAWSQTIASLFGSRLTWAIASVLLIVISTFAIYFIMNRRNVEQQLANQPSVNVQPGIKERSNSGPQDNSLPPSVSTGGQRQQLARVPQLPRRKRSRDTFADRMNTVAAKSSDPTSSSKLLRLEIQTKDPMIRIIWLIQPETKPAIPSSKGT